MVKFSLRCVRIAARSFIRRGRTSDDTIQLWDAATGKLLAVPGGTTENFVRIGHSLTALLMASMGGLLSRRLYLSGRVARDEEPIASP